MSTKLVTGTKFLRPFSLEVGKEDSFLQSNAENDGTTTKIKMLLKLLGRLKRIISSFAFVKGLGKNGASMLDFKITDEPNT